jgi:hypothetical protein
VEEVTHRRAGVWVGIASGAAAVVVAHRIAVLRHLEGSMAPGLIGAVLLFIAALLASMVSRRAHWLVALPLFAGIAIGVFVDAENDSIVNHINRNLWPIDIVFWWAVGVIPIALGILSGAWLLRRSRR